MQFPPDFLFGAATSAYQIEGASHADGKGLSIWDVFAHTPGKTWEGQTGDVACAHYQRFREDVALMQQLGLRAYRFSISWPRILPDGTGAINEKGLAFYERLVDALLAAGIAPWLTLYHWDLPYELHLRGGWLNPEMAAWFGEYTQVVVARLSDRVRNWITLNEPQVFVGCGYKDGVHAPGLRLALPEILRVTHNVLRAHGTATQVIRAQAKTPPQVGIAPNGAHFYPATDTPADIAAARTKFCAVDAPDMWNNTWFMDPIFFGHYPEDGLRLFADVMPPVSEADLHCIHQPPDIYCWNMYFGMPVSAEPGTGRPRVTHQIGAAAQTFFQWPVTPEAFYWCARFAYERYQKPIYVTENGMAGLDWVHRDGAVHDPQRIDFLTRYLGVLARAIADGVDVRGYFQWSLLDNIEWAEGVKQRFGLVYVDFATQQRVLKDSAYWYRDLIARTRTGNIGDTAEKSE
ncbi:MAG: GH1 family beta-glucosidase [bacterium]|nr:GH1 family beta-glucosidase [bacterium]